MSRFTCTFEAWMVARNDGEHYGQLLVQRFPRQTLVFGPTQIVNRINQDTEVARQISLWDQRRSEVIRGKLLVIPIEESLIYVQPLDGETVRRAVAHYERARAAQRADDWATYGGEMRLLGELLRQLNAASTPHP
jgi:uncharacterized membrane protein (UPF0182 family)